MRENEGSQRTHDVKKMAYLLEQLSNDCDIGTNKISNDRVPNSTTGRSFPNISTARAPVMRTTVILPRKNSFVKFKELEHNDLFITKSNDSYFEDRAARLNKRVSFNFEIQSDDGDVWSPFEDDLNDFQLADDTLKRIEKRSRVSKSFKPMQSFDESIEQVPLHDKTSIAAKPPKRKISFASFVKNVQKEKNSCTADSSLKDWKDGPITPRRNSFMNFIQNHKLSPTRPASAIKNRNLICRDSEGEDSISSLTTIKKNYVKSDQNSVNRPPPLIQPKPRRSSSRTSVTQIFNTNVFCRQSSTSSTHTVSWRNSDSFTRSDSGYSSIIISNQSLPPPMTDNQHYDQPSSANRRPSISQATVTIKRQLSQIPSNPIYDDFPDPLETLTRMSNHDACDIEQSRHRAVKSPKMTDECKRKETKSTLMMKTRRLSQNILGHISKKPRKSQTRSTRFIGVNKYKAFENLVSR